MRDNKGFNVFMVILAILGVFIIQIVCGVILGVYIGFTHSGSGDMTEVLNSPKTLIIITLVCDIFVAIFYGVWAFFVRDREKRIVNNKVVIPTIAGLFWAFQVYAGLLITFLYFIFPALESNYENAVKDISNFDVITVILTVIAAPISEELLFRGVIQKHMQKVLPVTLAVVLQALLFGIYHGNIVQGIYTFVIGLLLGLIVVKTGSVKYSIWAHFIFNASNYFWLLVSKDERVYMVFFFIAIILGIVAFAKLIRFEKSGHIVTISDNEEQVDFTIQ